MALSWLHALWERRKKQTYGSELEDWVRGEEIDYNLIWITQISVDAPQNVER